MGSRRARAGGGAYAVVDQLEAEDVGEKKDDLVFWIVALRRGDVAANAADRLVGALVSSMNFYLPGRTNKDIPRSSPS